MSLHADAAVETVLQQQGIADRSSSFHCTACWLSSVPCRVIAMVRSVPNSRYPQAARQQNRLQDAAWGKAVLNTLGSLSAEPKAVISTVAASRDGFLWIWDPINNHLNFNEPAGKALKALLRNGLLFQRLLVSSCKLPAAGLAKQCGRRTSLLQF